MAAETSLPGAVNPGNQNNKPTLAIRVSEHEATEEGAPVALGSHVPLTKQARLAIGFWEGKFEKVMEEMGYYLLSYPVLEKGTWD